MWLLLDISIIITNPSLYINSLLEFCYSLLIIWRFVHIFSGLESSLQQPSASAYIPIWIQFCSKDTLQKNGGFSGDTFTIPWMYLLINVTFTKAILNFWIFHSVLDLKSGLFFCNKLLTLECHLETISTMLQHILFMPFVCLLYVPLKKKLHYIHCSDTVVCFTTARIKKKI